MLLSQGGLSSLLQTQTNGTAVRKHIVALKNADGKLLGEKGSKKCKREGKTLSGVWAVGFSQVSLCSPTSLSRYKCEDFALQVRQVQAEILGKGFLTVVQQLQLLEEKEEDNILSCLGSAVAGAPQRAWPLEGTGAWLYNCQLIIQENAHDSREKTPIHLLGILLQSQNAVCLQIRMSLLLGTRGHILLLCVRTNSMFQAHRPMLTSK